MSIISQCYLFLMILWPISISYQATVCQCYPFIIMANCHMLQKETIHNSSYVINYEIEVPTCFTDRLNTNIDVESNIRWRKDVISKRQLKLLKAWTLFWRELVPYQSLPLLYSPLKEQNIVFSNKAWRHSAFLWTWHQYPEEITTLLRIKSTKINHMPCPKL